MAAYARVLPESWIEIDVTHPIFHTFSTEDIDYHIRCPGYGAVYKALFEHYDPTRPHDRPCESQHDSLILGVVDRVSRYRSTNEA